MTRKTILIFILFIATLIFFFSRFDFVSGKSSQGEYRLVMVDTVNGVSYALIGN